jgi:hypothetical protein
VGAVQFNLVQHPTSHNPPISSKCRSIFDIDNIDIGPERRAYLETKLQAVRTSAFLNSSASVDLIYPTLCLTLMHVQVNI